MLPCCLVCSRTGIQQNHQNTNIFEPHLDDFQTPAPHAPQSLQQHQFETPRAPPQKPRFRAEDLGTFDPTVNDVYAFTDRIAEVADMNGAMTVQTNVSLVLRGAALRWYEIELTPAFKASLRLESSGIHGWMTALLKKFQQSLHAPHIKHT